MARSRNIKPGLYKNEDLAECSLWARFIFPGLWMLADREGRLEDRPKRIKAELLAFDTQDVDPLLTELQERGFLVRYRNSEGSFIQISKFLTHQTPHYSEKASVIKQPDSGKDGPIKEPTTLEDSGKSAAIKGGSQPPDSLIPDSLIPDTGLSDSPKAGKSKVAATPLPEWIDPERWQAWMQIRPAKARTAAAQKAAIEKLTGFRSAGYDPNAIIAESLANGWQGIFAPKGNGTPGMSLGEKNRAAADEAIRRRSEREGRVIDG